MAVVNAYATRAALKAWLSFESANADHDEDLDRVIGSASRLIDRYCGRIFYTQPDIAKTFRAEVSYELDVPDIYSSTGLAVATDDDDEGTFETTWTISTDIQLEPTNPETGWPWRRLVAIGTRTFPTGGRRARVQVTAKWGWATVPPEVEQHCLLVAAELFKRKDAPFGVVGFDQIGNAIRVPASVVPLLEGLAGFRRLAVGVV